MMMKIARLVTAGLLAVVSSAAMAAGVNIIPAPERVVMGKGEFVLNKETKIAASNKEMAAAISLFEGVQQRQGLKLSYTEKEGVTNNVVVFMWVDSMAAEEYELEVTANRIECKATTQAGMFYAVQSVLQLLQKRGGKVVVPCVSVSDKPLYQWRGFMLDEARHFHGKDAVKQYLDVMANLKMNRFHWHLTDMEGWRIEIKRYPKLTQIGAVGNLSDPQAPAAFYTQDEIREIVAYAAERHITIVPEIDMPGHATAATRAYPEISGGGEGRWEGFTFNPAREVTYEFIDNVMTEVAELFPGGYIHVGADEVHYGNQSWFKDPEIQKFIRDNYLASEVGLEHYFIRRVCDIVNSKGKKMIGWDEIVNTGVTPDRAVVMWWRQERSDALTQSLAKGFEVIMNPRLPAYLDFLQNESHKTGRRWTKGQINTIDKVYKFPEMYSSLVGRRAGQVLGVQSVLFAETIGNKERLDFLIFPRLLAMAENGWAATGNKNYARFLQSVQVYMKYLDKLGIKYYNIFDPQATPEPKGPAKRSENPIANG